MDAAEPFVTVWTPFGLQDSTSRLAQGLLLRARLPRRFDCCLLEKTTNCFLYREDAHVDSRKGIEAAISKFGPGVTRAPGGINIPHFPDRRFEGRQDNFRASRAKRSRKRAEEVFEGTRIMSALRFHLTGLADSSYIVSVLILILGIAR